MIRLNRKYAAKEARESEAKSVIEWKIEFDKVPKLSKKSFKLWKKFIEWIIMQKIVTIVDFGLKIKIKYEIVNDRKYLKEYINYKVIYYKKDKVKYGQ